MNYKFRKPVSFAVKIIGLFLIVFTIMSFGESVSYIIVTGEHGTLGFDDEWIRENDTCQIVISVSIGSSAYKSGIARAIPLFELTNRNSTEKHIRNLPACLLSGEK